MNDFAQGAFNPANVVLLAGQKTVTYTVTASADAITELPENYSVKAEIGGVTVATKTTSLLDGGAADGGQTFTLTTGIDTPVATSGSDIFNGVETTAAGKVLGGLDVIDGAAGLDTMNIDNSQAAATFTFGGATIKNVETINVSTNGDFTGLDISGIVGLTSFKGTAADTAKTTLTAASTTDVNLTLGTTANSTVTGGKVVSVTKGAAAAGTLDITGKGLTEVTVKGGKAAVTIDNLENTVAATSAKGTTMTSVTLNGVDANSGVKGEGLTSITLAGATTAARTVTVTNAKADHSLTVNVDGTGYQADGTAAQSILADAAAKIITVNATGAKSSLSLDGSTAAKTVNITGSAALDLAALASATKIDGSAATGALTLNTLNAVTVDVKTGTGNDVFTATTTNKIAVDSGLGNDSVTLSGALVVGSTVNLNDGNDKLIGTTAVLKAGAGVTDSVINGGAGVDTVSAALINAGNAALFTNFEGLSLNSTTGLDAALLTGSTISALSMDAASTTALYQNLTLGQGLEVSYFGDNSGDTNTLLFKAVTGTTDTLAIKFTAVNTGAIGAAADVKAGAISAAGIENFTIDSAGTKVWNSLILTNDAAAKTVVITGAANLDLTFVAGANGFGSVTSPNTGVSLIDGSAATGKLDINVAGITAATAGLSVKGGTAVDTLTTSTFATTLDGGAGADKFVVTSAIAGAVATATTQVITTITGAASGDVLTFTVGGTNVFTTAKVDVSTATALSGGTVNAYDLAVSAAGDTNNQITWFQYGNDTYVVDHAGASATDLDTADVIVKLVGKIDLSTATFAEGGVLGASTLTLA